MDKETYDILLAKLRKLMFDCEFYNNNYFSPAIRLKQIWDNIRL